MQGDDVKFTQFITSGTHHGPLVEIASIAEKDDFDQYLDAAGVPPLPPSEFDEEQWSAGKSFCRSEFDGKAYKQYLRIFASK